MHCLDSIPNDDWRQTAEADFSRTRAMETAAQAHGSFQRDAGCAIA